MEYSYEKKERQWRVLSYHLERAAKIAKELSNYELRSVYPVSKASKKKMSLENTMKEALDSYNRCLTE